MKQVKGNSTEAVITLKHVRLSYCHLWEKGVFQGVPEDKYSTILLLDNDDNKTEHNAIKYVIQQILQEKNKGKKLPPDKYCFRDGQYTDKPGYGNAWLLSVKTPEPTIIGADKKPINKSDGLIYSGAYVNATVSLWFQNNPSGRRINGQLRIVQFCEHGDRLGDGSPSAEQIATDLDEFDDFSDDDDEIDGDDDFSDDDDI